MRKTLGVLAVVSAVLAAPAANAETWYAGGFGGVNFTHDGGVNASGVEASYDMGLAVGGYAGFYVQDNIRLEGELSYRANDLDTLGGAGVGGEAETLALMLNAFFDFKIESVLEPYLGAGIGFADVDYRVGGLQYDDTVLALQLVFGAGIEVAPTTQLTVDYRLFVTEDLDVGGGAGLGSVEYTNSAILVGLRKSF